MVWTTVVAPPACSSTTFGDFRPRGVLVKMAGAVVFFRNLPPHPPVLRHPDTLGRPWFGLQSSPRLLLHLHPDLRTGWTSRSLRSRRCNLGTRNLANLAKLVTVHGVNVHVCQVQAARRHRNRTTLIIDLPRRISAVWLPRRGCLLAPVAGRAAPEVDLLACGALPVAVVAVLPACLSRCRRNRLRSILAAVLLTTRTLDLTSRRRRTSTRSPAILVPGDGPAK